jgi:hypothetical protein
MELRGKMRNGVPAQQAHESASDTVLEETTPILADQITTADAGYDSHIETLQARHAHSLANHPLTQPGNKLLL